MTQAVLSRYQGTRKSLNLQRSGMYTLSTFVLEDAQGSYDCELCLDTSDGTF